MAIPIRFHLDESVPNAVALGLRIRGFDVTTSVQSGLLEAPDEAQLVYATREGRVLVTRDRDFLDLARSHPLHAGIVYAQPHRHGVGEIVRGLCVLASRAKIETIPRTVSYVSELVRAGT